MDVNNIFKILFELIAEQEEIKIEYQITEKNIKEFSNS